MHSMDHEARFANELITLFMRGQSDCANPIKNFLDFAAPVGHAGWLSRAMLEWVWLRKDNPKPGDRSK